MAVLICYNCGHKFDEDDAGTYRELMGEFWGAPAYEEFACCPKCRSDNIGDCDEEEEDGEEYENHVAELAD